MRGSFPLRQKPLSLHVGEVVEVRSEAEILSTLDVNGCLDALPFMPEMLAYCGKQFRVQKRADKTCDTISYAPGSRRMKNVVHLEGLRCDGSAHGGCQAYCLLFWKEAWLKRARTNGSRGLFSRLRSRLSRAPTADASSCTQMTAELLSKKARVSIAHGDPDEVTYCCQATELQRASAYLPWWDLRQYFRDLWWGNLSLLELLGGIGFQVLRKTLPLGAFRAQVWVYNRIQKMRGGTPYPDRSGSLRKTPTEDLKLQAGELVQVRPHDEILKTLDWRNKNRGLSFDLEMVPFCGGKYRVLQRVERIVNERTGKMNQLPGVCIMLEGVYCRAKYSNSRIGCPRSIFPYWREIWLRRAE